MAQNTELQERYSALVEAKLRSTSIFSGLFNHRYEGTPKAGAVKIPVRAEATAASYDLQNGLAATLPTTSYQTLVLDKDYAVNELIDGFVAAAVPDGMIADRLDSAGYAIGKKIDDELVSLLTTSGNYTAATTSETKMPLIVIDMISQAKEAKADPSQMWVAIAPGVTGDIMKSDYFQAVANMADVEKGLMGKIMGIPVYESNNLTNKHIIVGNRDFCHEVDEFVVPVAVNDLKDGAHIGCSAVQGRTVFGAAVTKPATVIYK